MFVAIFYIGIKNVFDVLTELDRAAGNDNTKADVFGRLNNPVIGIHIGVDSTIARIIERVSTPNGAIGYCTQMATAKNAFIAMYTARF